MTFILISGDENVGKTRVCNRLHGMLDQNGTFKLFNEIPSKVACREDHIRCYEKDGKHIVVNSPSDNDSCMEQFAEYLDGLAQKDVYPEIIVTTIRETNDGENQMCHMLALLEAIDKNTTNLLNYYKQNIARKSPAELAPQSLKHHAFVLHLEEQPVDHIKDAHAKTIALKPYMDDSADKIKYMIDFALARL